MLEKAMLRLLLVLLLVPVVAVAAPSAPEPDAAVSALTDTTSRYTIGPWEGSGQGSACTLTNSEPLALGSLELSLLHDQIIAQVTPAMPDAQPVVQEFPLDTASRPFYTIGNYVYDTHGLDRAFALFRQCLDGKLPAELPYEPIEESDPAPIDGDWQMITLKVGNYRYAAYAMLGETGLGLWVHNTDSFVLSITGFKDVAPGAAATLNGQVVSAVPQEDGVLIPLSAEQLHGLEAAGSIVIKIGEAQKSFAIKDFRKVVTALQPHE